MSAVAELSPMSKPASPTTTETARPTRRVLIVDGDPEARDQLGDFLSDEGFLVGVAASAREMEAALKTAPADLVILDDRLPDEDGLAVCRRLAADRGPGIIILSARADETDRIVGLEVGADDYLAKGCSRRELLARVRAVLRRRGPREAQAQPRHGWRLDLMRRELQSPEGDAVRLSAAEFELLRLFVAQPRTTLSRQQILGVAQGLAADSSDRSIDVHVSRLRKKIRTSTGAEPIRTIHGRGYMLTVDIGVISVRD